MYTAIVKNKEEVNEGIRVTVDFSNGTKTITETVIPQDEKGFKHWVSSRLTSLNSIQEIDSKYTVNNEVDLTEPEPTKTQAQLTEEQWFKDYYSWINVKTNLIDTGVITSDHPKAVALLNKVKTGLKAEYVDKI